MKIYETTYSATQPQAIEITSNKIFLASNIQQINREIEDREETCYLYTLTEYDKDEYLALLIQNQANVAALQEELEAAKVLLGVE